MEKGRIYDSDRHTDLLIPVNRGKVLVMLYDYVISINDMDSKLASLVREMEDTYNCMITLFASEHFYVAVYCFSSDSYVTLDTGISVDTSKYKLMSWFRKTFRALYS